MKDSQAVEMEAAVVAAMEAAVEVETETAP